jgi:zinc transporter ZupT
MLSFALTVLVFFVGTLIPAYTALYLISNLNFLSMRTLAAAGIGLTFWFFFDTMGDAADLSVNQTIYPFYLFGGWAHLAVIVAFLGGITALAIFDYIAVRRENSYVQPTGTKKPNPALLFLIPAGAAIVMGIHGLGEGWDFGSTATAVNNLLTAFAPTGPGQYNPLISYPIHKFLEASIIAVLYTAYVKRTSVAPRAWWQIPVLGVLFGMTSVIGTIFGYYTAAYTTISVDTTYFYAFGVTAAFYAAIRLAEALDPKFKIGENAPIYLGGKVFLALGIGFFLLYFAALLH